MEARVRYAPSPTGLQHIGSLRTALFNYLFARSVGGKFLVRLEDTDQTRCAPEYVQNLYDTFAWLGIQWNEGPDIGGPVGPYIQSQRLEKYREQALALLEKDLAYPCFCSSERLETIRAEREAAKSSETGYDRHCRAIPKEEAARRVAAGESHVIRLKIPLGESTRFCDHLLGDIEWKNDDVNPDPVLLKTDGFPTYHLANVVDDHLMGITHVLRAQEWVSSTPLHVIMYKAFGWEAPVFCHLPMVMGQDGKKLSKRHGSTSIDDFRTQGYLPEALVNYVALLGCSYEEGRDLYSLDELASLFRLEKLNKAPAVFDYKRLEWYNGQYIRMKTDSELADLIEPYAIRDGLFGSPGTKASPEQKRVFQAAIPLVKERLSFLHEASDKLRYLFAEPPLPAAEEYFPKKKGAAETVELLALSLPLVKTLSIAEDPEAEAAVKALAEQSGKKLGDLLMPLRVAITGARVSPPLFGSMRLLGEEACVKRIEAALELLRAAPAAPANGAVQ